MKLRPVISVVLFSLCLLPFAEAKRPKKDQAEDLAKTASMAMPDLQSVLGSAYQSPLELSDRATPGAVIEVTDFGYRPIINDCVGEDPVESAFTNITMQSSLSGGVSFGIGGQGASASGNKSVGLKFISPYILGFEMIRFKPSEKCRSDLEDYGKQYGLSNLMVVQEALFARINGCSEIAASVEGKVKAIGGEAAASASCQLFSNTPVAVGVRLVPVASFLGSQAMEKLDSKSGNPWLEEPSNSPQIQIEGGNMTLLLADLQAQASEKERLEAEYAQAKLEQSQPIQERARADWSVVEQLVSKRDEIGQKALEAFIATYESVVIVVGDQRIPVSIPEVVAAKEHLETYVFHVQHDGFETVVVPGGTFMMGCLPNGGDCGSDAKPRHTVTISHAMEVMTTEVTQGLYESVTGQNPSKFSSCGKACPVEKVSWYDAVAFANALSRKEGLSECYSISGTNVSWSDVECSGWRLPTEAEWEYLARGGGEDLYAGSNSIGDVAWYFNNSGEKTHPVGQKQANGFGLYDMSGNVCEWTWDWKGEYSSGSVTDPRGPSSGSERVYRGGCWDSGARLARASFRNENYPSLRSSRLGFRFLRKKN